MPKTVRWGIIGAGGIARKLAAAAKLADGAELMAIGSRTQEKAEQFANDFDIPHRHGSYGDLVADADVDAVYVATPHPMHKDACILALNAGKEVLCEKPFSLNAGQARQVIAVARAKGLFCMEAMWTRFVPPIVRLRELLAEGAVGEVRMMMADFGFRAGWDPDGRLLDPALGGGALLDVGCYAISLASMILGRPAGVTGMAHIGATGVDEQAAMALSYDGGRLALLATSVQTTTPQEATVLGTEGSIRLQAGWWRGSPMTLHQSDKEPELIEVPVADNGFVYQVEEVARCLAAGKTESDIMPLDETVTIMETMDQLRAQWGLKYPME